jgi:hypothetical protein
MERLASLHHRTDPIEQQRIIRFTFPEDLDGAGRTVNAKPEKFYESSLIVKSAADLPGALNPQNDVVASLADAMKAAKIAALPKLSGFVLDFDLSLFAGKRKPFRVEG